MCLLFKKKMYHSSNYADFSSSPPPPPQQFPIVQNNQQQDYFNKNQQLLSQTQRQFERFPSNETSSNNNFQRDQTLRMTENKRTNMNISGYAPQNQMISQQPIQRAIVSQLDNSQKSAQYTRRQQSKPDTPNYYFFFKNDCPACKHAIKISKEYGLAAQFRAVNVDKINRNIVPKYLTEVPAIILSTKNWNQVQPKMAVQGSVVFDFLEKNKPSNTPSVQEMVCSNGQCQISSTKETEPCKIEEWNDEWNSNFSDSYAFLDNTEEGMCHNFQFLDDISSSGNYDLTNAPMRSSPSDPLRSKIKELPQSSEENYSSNSNNAQSYSPFSDQADFNRVTSNYNNSIDHVDSYQANISNSNTGLRHQRDMSKKMIDLPDCLQPIDSKQSKTNENDLTRSIEQLKEQRNSM